MAPNYPSDPFTEDQRRLIVTVREHERYMATLPPSRMLQAILDDRHTEEYARDPDAVNPPSRAHLLRHHGRSEGAGPHRGPRFCDSGYCPAGSGLRTVAEDE